MANLREIKDRITSIGSTQQITRAMKMVSAAKLRKAQNRIIATRPYALKLDEVISRLVASNTSISSNFMLQNDTPENVLFIVVGSDSGLCGGFNNNLFKIVETGFRQNFQKYLDNNKLSLICIGRKSYEYFKKRGYNVVGNYSGFFDNLSFEQSTAVMKNVIYEFNNDKYQAVYVAYNEFKTVLTQNRKIDKILPISPGSLDMESDGGTSDNFYYIFEPSAEKILERLIPLHLNTQLWKAVLESNASEQGARMAAMDNATENAQELMRQLRLKYNQARQAAITTEISEIVSGAEALSE